MGCNCYKNQPLAYQWTGPNGETQTKRTEIEARALVIRQGGSYKPVPA